jgi:HSP20 family molecular chaperone IbpA
MAENKALEVEKNEIQTETERARDRRLYSAFADVIETEDAILVMADLPGVDENSVELTLEKNVLKIDAYPEIEAPQGYTLAYAEYGVGDFERSFVLSDEIDREKIEAKVKNGVLHLRLPKSGAARTRKIAVQAS